MAKYEALKGAAQDSGMQAQLLDDDEIERMLAKKERARKNRALSSVPKNRDVEGDKT